MNKIISKIGAVVVTITVFLFAICLIADLPFVSYLVCMFLPLGRTESFCQCRCCYCRYLCGDGSISILCPDNERSIGRSE